MGYFSKSLPILLLGIATPLLAQDLAFELPDHEGNTLQVAPSSKLTAICFLGTECPMARNYVATLNRLQERFADELRILGVMSNRQDSLEDVQRYVAELEVQFHVLHDSGNRIADQYGATRTPEVFLLDQELKLRYHGRIDDQFAPSVARAAAKQEDLKLAIEELLVGKPVSIKDTTALGCVIGRVKETHSTAPDNAITYFGHVKPVLERNCIECHRAGEIGPFSMQRFEEVVGWADTMLETIEDGRMPPWHADPTIGSFSNARTMPEEDKQVIRDWIQDGTHAGIPDSASPSTTSTVTDETQLEWQFEGQPDHILPMRDRPFIVPKQGVVEYQYFVVDPGFEEDCWIKAAQVLPGQRDVVHHAIVFVRPPDGSNFEGVGWLTGYVPGQRALQIPPGYARRIKAGSKFVFQMHYTPNGSRREDLTRVAIQLADPEDVTHRVITLMAINQDFEIPPNEANHAVEAKLGFLPAGGELLAVTPHMHFRGKSFELLAEPGAPDASRASTAPTASNADSSPQPLLSVPRYDFNWQHTYHFAEPINLDTLSRIRFTASFDNSAANPFNPDPEQWVSWGDQTWEEMAVSFFEVALPRESKVHGRKSEAAGRESTAASERKAAQREKYVQTVLEQLDKNRDGKIQKAEGAVVVRHFNFWYWDRNGDGIATRSEIEQAAEDLY